MGRIVHKHRERPAGNRDTLFEWTTDGDKPLALIQRRYGGAGDVLMTRPIFRAIKRHCQKLVLHVALPMEYAPLIVDLDEIDWIIPHDLLGDSTQCYQWQADISSACIRHEMVFKQNAHLNRTDIWARHVGIGLDGDYDAGIGLDQHEVDAACGILRQHGIEPGKLFAICPWSADAMRHLPADHVRWALEEARSSGLQPAVIHSAPGNNPWGLPLIHSLTQREWMAMMTQARLCLTTDTSHLHLAGMLGVPTAAMFCYTSGRVVAAHYPSVAVYQLAKAAGGMQCCPCYDWGSCKHHRQGGVLRCVTDIGSELVRGTVRTALGMPFDGARHTIRQKPVGWWRVLNVHPSTTKRRTQQPAQQPAAAAPIHPPERVGVRLSASAWSPALLVIAATIAVIAKGMRRNVRVTYVHGSGYGHEIVYGHRYMAADSPQYKDIEAWENHNLDPLATTLINADNSLLQAAREAMGIELTDGKPCLYIPPTTAKRLPQWANGQQPFAISELPPNAAAQRVPQDWPWQFAQLQATWDWQMRCYLLARAHACVTRDIQLAVVSCMLDVPTWWIGNPSQRRLLEGFQGLMEDAHG